MKTLIAFLLLILFAGCLEFDAQDVHLHHDADNDRLDMMFVYRGLFAEDGDVKDALGHYDEAMLEGDFALWNNWPLKVEATSDGRWSTLLKRHVRIENGGLFLDPAGTLCGYQFLRIEKVSRMLGALNQLIGVYVQTTLLAGDGLARGHEFDDETRELVGEFVRGRGQFVSLEGAALRIQLPFSAADQRWFMDRISGELLEGIVNDICDRIETEGAIAARAEAREEGLLDDDDPDEPWKADYGNLRPNKESAEFSLNRAKALMHASAFVGLLRDNPWSLSRERERLVFTLGFDGEASQVLTKPSSGRYEPQLLEALQARGTEIEVGMPEAELLRRFEAFRGRDAVLPEAYAAHIGQ